MDAEQAFTSAIARERSSRGLPPLAYASDLQAVARRHAQRMADRGEPYHNPDLATEVQGWMALGENVGMGPDVATVHDRFMASSAHVSLILTTDLTQVGVGVVRDARGYVWVAEVFRRPESASAPAPAPTPAPPPPTAPPPPPATTAAPPPPPTTTTVPAPPPTAPEVTVAAAEVERAQPVRLAAAEVAPAPTALPDVGEVVRHVPGAARVAAFLLAAVVGLQALVLRRLGLVTARPRP